MARDALDADGGSYPAFPRTTEGEWDTTKMPVGVHLQDGLPVDLTPRYPDGSPIVPPGMELPSVCRCSTHGAHDPG